MAIFARGMGDLVKRLREERLFQEKLQEDVRGGTVFFAIRPGYGSFYYKGCSLFSYDKDGFSTHQKFGFVPSSESATYFYERQLSTLRPVESFYAGYDRIKQNAAQYARGEAEGVSALYKYAPAACNPGTRYFLVDIEGSMVSRRAEKTITEGALEDAVIDTLRGKPGIALVQSSSQNIDRLVSFYRAALRLGRTFVVDIYTANVLQAVSTLGGNIMRPGYDRLRVFYPYRLTRTIFEEIGGEYATRFAKYRISREEIQARQREIIMLARPSMQRDLARCHLLGGTLFYSLWAGYREQASQRAFEGWLDANGFRVVPMHTSGHAKVTDIRRMIDGLNPQKIIPIHTMAPDAFLAYSDKVALQRDGAPFEIGADMMEGRT